MNFRCFGTERALYIRRGLAYQRKSWNIKYQFNKIVTNAGLGAIEAPFVNMRRSRSNGVLREYGAVLEREWIGHSTKVMQEHYFQVTDEDFLKASGKFSHAESHAQGREIATNVAISH